ncbi:HAD family hydrolase [Paenibacillus sp. MMS18-CY102]|uniref:HAD family hydrolase n=1 Tax=Paenibacillus sp. MMS18-CY102 TaxID=2682849 RepID=UPI001365E2F3|nr:HAD family hydrolase [Paenibacillus sp. MMS18-CY102]MWC29778.1 Cof-type HAD-IIB family hydrolase [Paenibacillus sp. MMS18-CY102]
MKLSAVVLDLDGTYLNADKQVSERNLAAVMACYDAGMKIIVATARPPRAVKWFLPEQLQNIAAFVYYNGAQVMCRHSNTELHESIPAPLTAAIIDYCLALYPNAELTMEVRDEWYSLRELDYSITMNAKENPAVKPLGELKQYDATKILITGKFNLEGMHEAFGHQANIIATDNNQLIQVMPLQASKERAVTTLSKRYGIAMDAIIVFGDDHNDIGLFKACGYSVAMGNAIPELKLLADEVAESHDRDGVAIVLERLLGECFG